MISLEKAHEIIQNTKINLIEEDVEVVNSIGRVISQDIFSGVDFPLFNNSAMDGYAYNSSSNSNIFKLIEIIPAGYISNKQIASGQCAKIMTGAMLPQGADRIIKLENTKEEGNRVEFLQEEIKNHIRYKGEFLKKGDKVIEKSTLITAKEIACLSAIGKDTVKVYQQPTVGILTTGSELLTPGEQLKPGKIYDSNGYQIYHQVTSIVPKATYYGTVKDDEPSLKEAISIALTENDFVIISGGVSKGCFDYVPRILEDLFVDIKFSTVAIKPGKPTIFGVKEDKIIFGLPGNPIPSFIICEIFVKKLLYQMMGYNFEPVMVQGNLTCKYHKKNIKQSEYVPVCFDGKSVTPVNYYGSGHIFALSKTNALLKIDPGVCEINKGELVSVRQL